MHKTIPYHTGGVLENRAGLQVLRTCGQHLQRVLRTREIDESVREHVRRMDEDGIAVIENFLSPEDLEQVSKEFENVVDPSMMGPYRNVNNAKLYRVQIPVSDRDLRFAATQRHFRQNEKLNRIAAAVVRRKVDRLPDVHFDLYENLNDDGFDNDVENLLHADLHTTTVKMFFFLNDVTASNGAFVYVKRSHRLTAKRLRHEYELSVRQAKMRRGHQVDPKLVCRRGDEIRNIIDPKRLSEMGLEETQFSVKANTLVIANNMGFHRRGEFEPGKPRKAVQINFRNLEQPFGKRFFSSLGK